MPRLKGYRKDGALDGGYLNVRLSSDLMAKLDADCAAYAQRVGKPASSKIRSAYVRELISAGSRSFAPAELEPVSQAVKSVAWNLEAAACGAPETSPENLQEWSDRLLEAALVLDRLAGER